MKISNFWRKQKQLPYSKQLLQISSYAMEKIRYINSLTHCETGGFGISDPDDLFYIKDFEIIKQTVTGATIKFDDIGVADYFEQQVDAGRKPQEFARIWVHSHPFAKQAPSPSFIDEDNFKKTFGQCDWAIMLIVNGRDGYYARLRQQKKSFILKMKVSKNGQKVTNADKKKWQQQFKLLVEEKLLSRQGRYNLVYGNDGNDGNDGVDIVIRQPRIIIPSRKMICHLPQHLLLPKDIDEQDFIDYCNAWGMFNLGEWNQNKLDYWVKEYRTFTKGI